MAYRAGWRPFFQPHPAILPSCSQSTGWPMRGVTNPTSGLFTCIKLVEISSAAENKRKKSVLRQIYALDKFAQNLPQMPIHFFRRSPFLRLVCYGCTKSWISSAVHKQNPNGKKIYALWSSGLMIEPLVAWNGAGGSRIKAILSAPSRHLGFVFKAHRLAHEGS